MPALAKTNGRFMDSDKFGKLRPILLRIPIRMKTKLPGWQLFQYSFPTIRWLNSPDHSGRGEADTYCFLSEYRWAFGKPKQLGSNHR